MQAKHLRFLIACSSFIASSFSCAEPVQIDVIALSGDAAPGITDGFFATFSDPKLNRNGDIAFRATLEETASVDARSNQTLWLKKNGEDLTLIARNGRSIPNYPGTVRTLSDLGPPSLDSNGNVAFRGGLIGSADTGIWITSPLIGDDRPDTPDVWMLVREDDDALTDYLSSTLPPAPAKFEYLGQPSIGPDGTTTFWAILKNNGFDGVSGIWSKPLPPTQPNGVNKLPNLIALTGKSALHTSEKLLDPQIANESQASNYFYKSTLTDDEENISGVGLWNEVAILRRLLFRNGNIAPGTNLPYFDFGRPIPNKKYDLAFWGGLESENNQEGIWIKRFENTELLALAGTAAPNMPVGSVFDSFFDPIINNRGLLAFLASVKNDDSIGIDDSNNQAIWHGGSKDLLKLVARTGEIAPGATPHASFESLSQPLLNELGQIAFSAFLKPDSNVNSQNNFGIWAMDINGILNKVMQTGDTIEVAPGDNRTVKEITISKFNDSGELLLAVRFADDTQALIKATIPIPDLEDFVEWTSANLSGLPDGPEDDADEDGVPNIIEFAFGLNPTSPDLKELPKIGVIKTSNGAEQALTLSFKRRIEDDTVTYKVEVSTDLVTWNSGEAYTAEIDATLVGNGLEEVVVRDLTEAGLFDRCFIRIRLIYD